MPGWMSQITSKYDDWPPLEPLRNTKFDFFATFRLQRSDLDKLSVHFQNNCYVLGHRVTDKGWTGSDHNIAQLAPWEISTLFSSTLEYLRSSLQVWKSSTYKSFFWASMVKAKCHTWVWPWRYTGRPPENNFNGYQLNFFHRMVTEISREEIHSSLNFNQDITFKVTGLRLNI